MKINITKLLLSVFFTWISNSLFAQQVIKKKADLYLNTFAGYGTENNYGNTAFFVGATLSKPVTKHLFLEAGLTRFTTDIYNAYRSNYTNFKGEYRKYNAWFTNIDLKYTFGNEKSLVNASIKAGPSLKYYRHKSVKTFQAYHYPDGHEEVIPNSIQYYDQKGFNISLYNSVSFDAKVNPKLRLGLFLDVYSYEIPIEHFMPGINAVFKL